MIAFVLSGGGNLGALQVGALQVLMEAGIYPELLVGTSAGSVNGAYLATNPTLEGVQELTQIWKVMDRDDIFPGNAVRRAWYLVTRQDGLCSRKNLIAFLEHHTPEGMREFRHLETSLYLVATDLLTGRRYLFGEDPTEKIMDGILASTAVPPYFSPWIYRDKVLVDGGISDNLPISVAVEKGGTEIFAFDIIRPSPIDDGHWNVFEVATLSLKDLIVQQRNRDLSLYSSQSGITLHYLPLKTSLQIGFDDFDHASELIEDGRKAATAYLAEHKCLRKSKSDGHSISSRLKVFGEKITTFFSVQGLRSNQRSQT